MLSLLRSTLPVLVLGLVAALASGCSGEPDSGPLELGDFGLVADGQELAPYFVLDVCPRNGDPVKVKITGVSATRVTGTDRPVGFRVAWSDGPEFVREISGRQPVPDAYEAAQGATGNLTDKCGALAIVFPEVLDEPVTVDGVEVDYEYDGEAYTATSSASLTQCPLGTRGEFSPEPEGDLCAPDTVGGDRGTS